MKRLLLVCVLLGGCDIFGLGDDVADELRDQKRAWVSQGIRDYSYEYVISCFCPPPEPIVITVRNNVVTSAIVKRTGADARAADARTMTQLYDYLIDVAEDADEMNVEFDNAHRIPINVQVDMYKNAVDDEFAIGISNFTRLN